MTASNLSICVGPSILWSSDQAYMMDQNYSKEVNYTCLINYTRIILDVQHHNFPGLCAGSDPN